MYYLNNRYYDPVICRFINADTTDVLTVSSTSLSDKNLYAYCNNNPVNFKDATGFFAETALDIVSLAASVTEVMANPKDPWAWAGLAGDAIDLVPFVTGVGEVTKVAKITVKAVDTADKSTDVVKAARRLYNKSGVLSDIRRMTGSYEITYKSGMTYVGKGGFYRATRSANRYVKRYGDEVASLTWKPARTSTQAFIDEYISMCKYGGPNNKALGNTMSYNKISSPGQYYYYKIHGRYYS